jgi:hypothetical protein
VCQLANQPRGTQRYQPKQREDEDRLTQAIITLASQHGCYGYRRITALLKRAGWQVGKDRVERIWRREGLKVPQKQKPRGRLWFSPLCLFLSLFCSDAHERPAIRIMSSKCFEVQLLEFISLPQPPSFFVCDKTVDHAFASARM